MHVGQILKADTANGVGIRVSVFVSGCTNACPGCFNPQTWDFNYGELYDRAMEDSIMAELSKNFYAGLTILGGEPFEIANQRAVIGLIRRVKRELPDKNIWMYSGFTYDTDLAPGGKRYCEVTDEILDSIDILVDGLFVLAKKNLMLKFRGSSNQRIIDVKRSRAEGRVVLSELNNEV